MSYYANKYTNSGSLSLLDFSQETVIFNANF